MQATGGFSSGRLRRLRGNVWLSGHGHTKTDTNGATGWCTRPVLERGLTRVRRVTDRNGCDH